MRDARGQRDESCRGFGTNIDFRYSARRTLLPAGHLLDLGENYALDQGW
jgi:hypothetical protein